MFSFRVLQTVPWPANWPLLGPNNAYLGLVQTVPWPAKWPLLGPNNALSWIGADCALASVGS